MDITAFIFDGVRVLFGYLLLLFIPGFILSMVLFPRFSDLRIIERLVYSMVLSVGSVLVLVLFMDVLLGMDTTPMNIVLVLIGVSLILINTWIARWFFLTFSISEKISDGLTKTGGHVTGSVTARVKGAVERIRNRSKKSPDSTKDEL